MWFWTEAPPIPGDLSWEPLERLGDLTVYGQTPQKLAVQRLEDAQAVILNRLSLGREEFSRLPKLRYVGTLATGYNTIDVKAARERGITVCNVPHTVKRQWPSTPSPCCRTPPPAALRLPSGCMHPQISWQSIRGPIIQNSYFFPSFFAETTAIYGVFLKLQTATMIIPQNRRENQYCTKNIFSSKYGSVIHSILQTLQKPCQI